MAVGGIGSAIGNETVALTTAAVGGMAVGVAQARQAGGEIVSNLVQGVRSGVAPVAAAGRELTEVLVGGVVSAFGDSGQAVSRVVSRGLDTIGRTASSIFDGVGNSLSRVGELAGTAIGAVTTGIGALGGAILGPVGALVGGVVGAAMGAIGTKVLAGVTGLFCGVLKIAGESIGAIGGMFAEGFRGVLDIGRDTFDNLKRYSREVLSIAQQSGMGVRNATVATSTLGAFGVNAGNIEALSQSQMISRITGGMFGIGGAAGSPEWLSSLRGRYQGMGGAGSFMAESMLRTVAGRGGADELRGVVNMPDAIFNRQLATSQRLQGSLGLQPEEIARAEQNWGTLVASVGSGVNHLKNLVANAAMPYLIKAVEGGIGWLERNAGRVREGIQAGVRWLFEELPPMLLRAGAVGMQGVSAFLGGLSNMAGGLAGFAEGLQAGLPGILTTLDNVLNGIRDFVAGAAGIVGFLSQIGTNIANPETRAQAIRGGVGGALLGGIGGAAVGGAIGYGLGYGVGTLTKIPGAGPTMGGIGARWGARIGGTGGAGYGLYKGAERPLLGGPTPGGLSPDSITFEDAPTTTGMMPGFGEVGDAMGMARKAWNMAMGAVRPFRDTATPIESARGGGVAGGSPSEAANAWRERFLAAVPESNLAARYGGSGSALSRMIGGAAGGLRTAEGYLDEKSQGAAGLAAALNRQADAYERMIQLMQSQEGHQREIAGNTRVSMHREDALQRTLMSIREGIAVEGADRILSISGPATPYYRQLLIKGAHATGATLDAGGLADIGTYISRCPGLFLCVESDDNPC